MSRIGNKVIVVPEKVSVEFENSQLKVQGPKGALCQDVCAGFDFKMTNNEILVICHEKSKYYRALHGLYRSLLNGMVIGVKDGFKKTLNLNGVGYRASLKGKELELFLGFSHTIKYLLPEQVDCHIENGNRVIVLQSFDKCLLGQTAAQIRNFRKVEPYKKKGICYSDEVVIGKAGKSGKSN